MCTDTVYISKKFKQIQTLELHNHSHYLFPNKELHRGKEGWVASLTCPLSYFFCVQIVSSVIRTSNIQAMSFSLLLLCSADFAPDNCPIKSFRVVNYSTTLKAWTRSWTIAAAALGMHGFLLFHFDNTLEVNSELNPPWPLLECHYWAKCDVWLWH